MRKIGFTQYKKTTKEVLPKTYKVKEITCQRKMFCIMINQYLSNKSQLDINNEHLFENDLLSIFEDKIMSFFQFYKFKPEKPQKVVHIFKQESLLINQYFKQSQNLKMQYMTRYIQFNPKFKMLYGYSHPSIDLIQLIFNGKEIEMMLDLNEIFTRTVFNRIKKDKDKKISLDTPYIHISQNNTVTRLHPRWKHVDPKKLQERREHIQEGISQLQEEEIDQCYLVYPKTDKFQRHIILNNESSKDLKMIPYSFTFTNKKEKKCKK